MRQWNYWQVITPRNGGLLLHTTVLWPYVRGLVYNGGNSSGGTEILFENPFGLTEGPSGDGRSPLSNYIVLAWLQGFRVGHGQNNGGGSDG